MMDEASTQLKEILVAGNLLVLPGLPGPSPSREAPQDERETWERATLELSCLAPLAGLPQAIALSCSKYWTPKALPKLYVYIVWHSAVLRLCVLPGMHETA